MLVGLQETLTEVIVGEDPPPPMLELPLPQPASKDDKILMKTSQRS
jgi:hypothetical protein